MTTIQLINGEKIITQTHKMDVWAMCIGSDFIRIEEDYVKSIALPSPDNPQGKHETVIRDVFIAVNKIVKIY